MEREAVMTKNQTTTDESQTRERKPPIVEKRQHPRQAATLDVQLYWKDDTGVLHDAEGVVVNASAGGFGVETDCGLAVGRIVTLRTYEGSSMQCVVRHTQDREGGVVLGLKVLPTSRGERHEESIRGLSDALDES